MKLSSENINRGTSFEETDYAVFDMSHVVNDDLPRLVKENQENKR